MATNLVSWFSSPSSAPTAVNGTAKLQYDKAIRMIAKKKKETTEHSENRNENWEQPISNTKKKNNHRPADFKVRYEIYFSSNRRILALLYIYIRMSSPTLFTAQFYGYRPGLEHSQTWDWRQSTRISHTTTCVQTKFCQNNKKRLTALLNAHAFERTKMVLDDI